MNGVLVGNTVGSESLPHRVPAGRADWIRTSDPLLPKVSRRPSHPPHRHRSPATSGRVSIPGKMTTMDQFEGRCWLNWWANSATLMEAFEVAVVITASCTGWEAHGHLISHDDAVREGFAFLCDLDPVFELRFEDGTTVGVNVQPADERGRFALTEYTGPDWRQVAHQTEL
jgi:hypothetical protein